jgi:hypothetical protein
MGSAQVAIKPDVSNISLICMKYHRGLWKLYFDLHLSVENKKHTKCLDPAASVVARSTLLRGAGSPDDSDDEDDDEAGE